jgi:hypothetical protein
VGRGREKKEEAVTEEEMQSLVYKTAGHLRDESDLMVSLAEQGGWGLLSQRAAEVAHQMFEMSRATAIRATLERERG